MFDRLVKRSSLGLAHFFLLMLLISGFSLPALAQAKPQTDLTGKNVLVLQAWEANLPMSTETNKALSRVFSSGGMPAFNQSFECLDLRRNPGPEYKKLLAEKMRLQYGDRKPDLIIAVNPIAMRFATDDCRGVFADTPILALMLPTGFQVPKTSRRLISHFPSLDIVRTLDIAFKLVPHAKRVYVASGSYETDIAFENQVRRVSKKWEGRLQFLYLSSMPFEDMLAAVSKAPPDSIVLALGFARDVSGKLLTTPTAIQRLSQVSAVPVFGIADVALGHGIAGGFLSSYEFIGTKAGELALDILRGVKTTDSIPDVLDVPTVPMFDWRQLRRWKLSETALPKGSIVINKELTLWDYRYYIIGALVFCLAETALMIFLIVQRRWKKVAEEGLRQKKEELDQFFDVSLDLLGIANLEGYFLRLNPAAESILGYTREELMEKRFFEFVHPDDVDRTMAAVSTLSSQQKVFSFENRYRCKDGTYRWLQWSSAPAGNLIYAAARDITERKRAEEELRKYREHLEELVKERTAELVMARDEAEGANRAKSTFLANMSHELRTPLNSILGIAQLMERDAGFPFQHRDTLKILSHSGAYLLDLINDVLEMSKIEAGKMAPVKTSFDLHSLLGDLEEMMRLRADQKGLMLLFEHQPHLPQYIETDVRLLRQILVNLLSNAIKFTEKGRVTLRIAFEEGRGTLFEAKGASLGRLKFEVEDTGIGIAPEDRQRIFEPFVQVNPGRTAREGTGLGLTLSRMLIEMLGGEITVRGQVRKGSTFAFDIPVKQAEGAAIRTPEADRKLIGLMQGQPSYRLLVVDDSIENRFVLRRLLEQGGFTVSEAASGQEAVGLFESLQPHLIWMDVRMPGMDGREAAQRIREAERGRRNEEGKEIHTPIIALTADVMDDQKRSSLDGVFDDWVYKPYREKEILNMLEKHLRVQFVYQPSMESVAVDKDRAKGVTSAQLAVLPSEWLREFSQVLRKGHSAQVNDLIGRISPEHADLAGTLAELVHVYRFNDLMVATEGALQDASDG